MFERKSEGEEGAPGERAGDRCRKRSPGRDRAYLAGKSPRVSKIKCVILAHQKRERERYNTQTGIPEQKLQKAIKMYNKRRCIEKCKQKRNGLD